MDWTEYDDGDCLVLKYGCECCLSCYDVECLVIRLELLVENLRVDKK